MKILKSLAVVAGAALLTLNVSAQQKSPMDAQQMTNQIKQKVTGITPDQESKILAAEQEFVKGAQDVRSSSAGDRDAMRSKMQPLRESRDSKIKAILSAAQFTQYKKIEAAHKGGNKSGN